jgi:hypothetical protein
MIKIVQELTDGVVIPTKIIKGTKTCRHLFFTAFSYKQNFPWLTTSQNFNICPTSVQLQLLESGLLSDKATKLDGITMHHALLFSRSMLSAKVDHYCRYLTSAHNGRLSLTILYLQTILKRIIFRNSLHLKSISQSNKFKSNVYSGPLTYELNSFARAGRNSSWS